MSFVVEIGDDSPDAKPGDGVCESELGGCTLRAAVDEGNATGNQYEVVLPPGQFVLSAGPLLIRKGWLVLRGGGADVTVIRGASTREGVIINDSLLTLVGVAVTGGYNAGVYNRNAATLVEVDAAKNGIGVDTRGPLVVYRSTLRLNSAGLKAECGAGDVELENVTISGNHTDFGGGISICHTSLTLRNVTVSDNYGFGIWGSGTITASGTIIASNYRYRMQPSPIENCVGELEVSSLGANLDDDDSCYFDGPHDLRRVDPLLTPLRDNGGPTYTHGLLENSPAIDALDLADCPDHDQRGVSRPQGALCDIGAYESDAPD